MGIIDFIKNIFGTKKTKQDSIIFTTTSNIVYQYTSEKITGDFLNIKKFISLSNENGIVEVNSFFNQLNGLDGFNREFWIAENKETKWLSEVLSIYSINLNIPNLSILIKKANSFLREMKKDVEFWNDYKIYRLQQFELNYNNNCTSNLSNLLSQLSIGERLHFFDYACTVFSRKYWGGLTSARTRRFDFNETISIEKMITLGIFIKTKDIESIPEIISKGELKELAEKAGFELKKSWNLEKIFDFLKSSENGISFLNNHIEKSTSLVINSEYINDTKLLVVYSEKIKRLIDLLAMV